MTCRRLVISVVMLGVLAAACTNGSAAKPATGLDKRTTTIGDLEVTVTPTQLDGNGAAFTIAFDTHTGAPTIDVAANAALTVDGAQWTTPTWSGDGPGGHHRAGTLRFTAAGPARDTARLAITGLDQPLELTWQLQP